MSICLNLKVFIFTFEIVTGNDVGEKAGGGVGGVLGLLLIGGLIYFCCCRGGKHKYAAVVFCFKFISGIIPIL